MAVLKQKYTKATTSTLSELFEVTTGTIMKWRRTIEEVDAAYIDINTWNLKKFLDWWLDNVHLPREESDTEVMHDAKERYWAAKAINEELKTEKIKGQSAPVEEIYGAWASRMMEMAKGLESLVMRLPPVLEGKNQREMREIIYKQQQTLRNNFCRISKFCPKEKASNGKKTSKPTNKNKR